MFTKRTWKNKEEATEADPKLEADELNRIEEGIEDSLEQIDNINVSKGETLSIVENRITLNNPKKGALSTVTLPVVNNLTSTSTTSALSASQGKKLNDELGCVYGTSTNQEYWEYNNGLLIIKMAFNVSATVNTTWGAMKISQLFAGTNYAVAFTNDPAVTLTAVHRDYDYLVTVGLAGSYTTRKTKSPSYYLIKDTTLSAMNYYVTVTAIGRWK